jgi:putative serine protease PepD
VLLIAAPFAAGAVAAAGVITGVGATGSSSPESAATAPVSSSATSIAQAATQLDAATIYKRSNPGVVDVTATQAAQGGGVSPFVPGGSQQAQAGGTGYVYDKSGHIITAEHVVDGASSIRVRFSDGSTAKATLVGTDASTDTAVIKVSVPAGKLTPLPLADSSDVEPGEGVVAIGSPFGLSESITAGIVSAVDRTIEAPNGYSISNTIQTDAPINHGNSGGPLIDETGKVIGTNVQIAVGDQATSSTNAGVGFAVPSNTVRSVVQDLIAGKAVQHAYLGVAVGDSPAGSGARIGTVRSGSPAASAGLRVGDVVTAADGRAIADANALTAAVGEHRPGDTLRLTVQRGDSTVTVTVKLGTRPATTTA